MVTNYENGNFNEMIQSKVLVDFYANWCGPCRMLAPQLEEISKEIDIIKVDIDKNQELARKYGVMSIPCIIIFDKGVEVKRQVGFQSANKLREFIK